MKTNRRVGKNTGHFVKIYHPKVAIEKCINYVKKRSRITITQAPPFFSRKAKFLIGGWGSHVAYAKSKIKICELSHPD